MQGKLFLPVLTLRQPPEFGIRFWRRVLLYASPLPRCYGGLRGGFLANLPHLLKQKNHTAHAVAELGGGEAFVGAVGAVFGQPETGQ